MLDRRLSYQYRTSNYENDWHNVFLQADLTWPARSIDDKPIDET